MENNGCFLLKNAYATIIFHGCCPHDGGRGECQQISPHIDVLVKLRPCSACVEYFSGPGDARDYRLEPSACATCASTEKCIHLLFTELSLLLYFCLSKDKPKSH